jgi:hypothetical protein
VKVLFTSTEFGAPRLFENTNPGTVGSRFMFALDAADMTQRRYRI